MGALRQKRAIAAVLVAIACTAFVVVISSENGTTLETRPKVTLTPQEKAAAVKIGKTAAETPLVKPHKPATKAAVKTATKAAVKTATDTAATKAATETTKAKKPESMKEAKKKLTLLEENCMHLEQYGYAAFDKLVDMDGISQGGIAVALVMGVASGGDHPPLASLTPQACVARYTAFLKNASARVEKDGIPFFQIKAIKHSMANRPDGILKAFKIPYQGRVTGIDGPAVGLSETPNDWKMKLGVTASDIREMWNKIAPGRDMDDLAMEEASSKDVFGQDVFDKLFKAECRPKKYEGPAKNIHMGCKKLSNENECKKAAECEWLKPWDGDFQL